MQTQTAATYREIPLADIVESKWNPRKHFAADRLQELADSIRAKGVIEPIVVRPNGKAGKFEIVAGARRHRAAKIAGLENIPSLVRELSEVDALELAVIENLQRDDVNPIDEAEGYEALAKADKRFTPAVIAAKVGKSESYIYRRLKLLQLEKPLREALAEDRLTVAHAEKLCRLSPERRKEAIDLRGRGVVWSRSPLLDYNEKWIPSKDDLLPLADLERFIREKSHFDPRSEDARHFQPSLGEELDELTDDEAIGSDGFPPTAEEKSEALATLVELTLDSMARMRMGAKPTDQIPLTPSKWREIKKPSQRCEFATRGVITQGTERYGQVIECCITKRCHKHFPPPKPKKSAKASSKQNKPAESTWERQQRLDREAREQWEPVWEKLKPLVVTHFADVKLTGALVLTVIRTDGLDRWNLEDTEREFKVKTTDKNLAHVLALMTFRSVETRADFLDAAKTLKFPIAKLEGIEKQLAAAAKSAKKAAVDEKPAKAKRGGRK